MSGFADEERMVFYKKTATILFVLLAVTVWACTVYRYQIINSRNQIVGFYRMANGEDVTIERYYNGKISKRESEFKAKQLTRDVFYYRDGSVSISSYKDEKRDGVSKNYNNEGELLSVANFKEGKRVGVSKAYYENGKLFARSEYDNDIRLSNLYYDKEGQPLNGKVTVYWKNENARCRGSFINGFPEGKLYHYDLDGELGAKGTYENGRKIHEKNYVSGEVHWEYTYKNGKTTSEKHYPEHCPIIEKNLCLNQ